MPHIQIDDTTPIISYDVGSTPLTAFPVPFAFFENSDLVVTVNDNTTLVLDVEYTVTGAGESTGGTLTLEDAVSNVTLVIERILPIERVTDFPNSGPLDMVAVNTQFDKNTAIDQQLQAGIDQVTQDIEDVRSLIASGGEDEITTTAVSQYATRGAVALAEVDTSVLYVQTAGYYIAGDGGGALYKRVSGQPSHAGKVQTSNSVWFEIVGTTLSVKAFGVHADGVVDDTALLQGAIDSPAKVLLFPSGTILISSVSGLTGVSGQVWQGEHESVSIIKLNVVPTSELITFSSKTNWAIRDLSIDWNNKVPAGTNSSLGIGSCSEFHIQRVVFDHIGRIGISATNISLGRIEDCTFKKDTIVLNQLNQAILFTASGGANYSCRIVRNRFVNCGSLLDINRSRIQDNDVDGFGYGSGFAFTAHNDTHTNIISGNTITNGSVDEDADMTRPGGFENWGANSIFSGNISFNNGGCGGSSGGQHCAWVANIMYGNGAHGGEPGIFATSQDAIYNGQYSVYVGNVAFDPRITLGTQSYGFDGALDNINYSSLFGNSFYNNKIAPQRMGSGSYRSFSGPALEGSSTFNPSSLADGAGETTPDITVAGAALGDKVEVSFSNDLQGVKALGWVSSANAVKVRFENVSGGTVDLASGTIRVTVVKHSDHASF